MFEDILTGLLEIPLAYDTGIDIRTTRTRKLRKGARGMSKRVETIVMSSKEVVEVGGMALEKLLKSVTA